MSEYSSTFNIGERLDQILNDYDKEEGKYLYLETVTTEIADDVTVPVLMKISYNFNDKDEIEVNSISLNEGESIEVAFPNGY